jgi:Tfp pilus assembly protein PilO
MPKNNPTATVARPPRRDRRKTIRFTLATLLGVNLILVALVFWPAGQSYASQKQELEKLRADAQGKRELVGRGRMIEANLATARKQGDDFYNKQFLPSATGYSVIMEEIDKLAQSNGVKKGGVGYTVGEVKNRPDLQSIDISTTLEGEYSKIVKFINRLEQSQLFLIVDSMNAASNPQTRTVKLTVHILTYFRVT